MARPKSFDPEHALRDALHVFWREGYESTSLSDLEAALGIGRKSLYDTFGNKRELFLRTLELYGRRRPPVERPDAGWAEIVACFNGGPPYHPEFHSCFMVNTSVEFGAERDVDVTRILRWHNESLRAGFEGALTRAIADGDAPKQDVEAGALFLSSALQGLSVMGRVGTPAEQMHGIAARTLAAIQAP
ncbi:MAG: TetR/AcrR family transcriptional regulator [Alphaproteobacteria bacterium]|nr:TetR/AcrR family transcriptional regulator [Alphaproteobacteria bacterium]